MGWTSVYSSVWTERPPDFTLLDVNQLVEVSGSTEQSQPTMNTRAATARAQRITDRSPSNELRAGPCVIRSRCVGTQGRVGPIYCGLLRGA